MSGIQRLQAKRDKLLILAKKKRIIDARNREINKKKMNVKREELALRKEILSLKAETKRDILKMIKKRVTSPESKRTFKRAKILFKSIQKSINTLNKRIN